MDKNNSNNKPKISVVIPVYNMAEYLPECLDSVLNQTLHDIEVICVDDGSTDNSLEILHQYQQNDNRIVVLTQTNSGSGPARNNGIYHGHGQYVAFMDPDDWYPENDILQILYIEAVEHDVFICGGVHSIWEESTQKYYVGKYNGYTSIMSYNQYGLVNYSDYQSAHGYLSFIYDQEWLISNNILFPPYRRGQDPPFFAKAMATAGRYYAINKVTYCYRKNHKQIKWNEENTADFLQNITDLLKISSDYSLPLLHIKSILEFNSHCINILSRGLYDNSRIQILIRDAEKYIDYNLILKSNCHESLVKLYIKLYIKFINRSSASEYSSKLIYFSTYLNYLIFSIMWACEAFGFIPTINDLCRQLKLKVKHRDI